MLLYIMSLICEQARTDGVGYVDWRETGYNIPYIVCLSGALWEGSDAEALHCYLNKFLLRSQYPASWLSPDERDQWKFRRHPWIPNTMQGPTMICPVGSPQTRG